MEKSRRQAYGDEMKARVEEQTGLACIVLAAGKGTRMRSSLPKVLHPLAGKAMLAHVFDTVLPLGPERVVLVVGPDMDQVAALANGYDVVVQEPQLGTGHAVQVCRDALADFEGDLLVLYGDTPLITSETLARMRAARHASDGAALVALGFRSRDPGAYGRMLLDASGRLERVVEALDADPATRSIGLCNAGLLLADAGFLFELLARIGSDNAKGEYYLTDIYELAARSGRPARVVEAEEAEVLGVNSRAELAVAEAAMQRRLREAAMASGAFLPHPDSVILNHDTVLEPDATVEANVVFGPGVTVRSGARIRAFSHLEGAVVGANAVVGPYARLRPGTVIEEAAHVGNFVEVKNATLGRGAKANHLTYIGDATVGAGSNVGAGTITCNYDGFAKHRTEIGEGVFIGSNVALVAPVTLGDGAVIGAGSTVAEDVPADAVMVVRADAKLKPEGAKRYRSKREKQKG
jgi:bifunctional UDP-N-acetylglucosamine pyrophosphorylase/glucosamine-1-phosphate N-acetyltransferase